MSKNVGICNYYHYLVGGCHKKVKLSITFRYKSLMFTLFLHKRNFSTSQARKKSFFLFQPKAIAKGLLILDNCETKKCFIVLHNNIVVLTKRKKTSDLVCLFFASFILETWKKKQL